MKIEEAITHAIMSDGHGKTTNQIADAINRNGWHIRKDGKPVTSAQYPLTILSGLIAVLPTYKNTLRSQKCVPCGHYQKLLRDAGVTTAPNSLLSV